MNTTSTTQVDRREQDGRKRRKGIIGVAAMATAGALVLGLGYAYFSDTLAADATATAGTLDLVDTADPLAVYVNGVKDDDGVVTNLNPGDLITVKGTVTNAGSKSAWVREAARVTAVGDDIADYLYFYDTAVDQDTLLGTAVGDLTGNVVTGTGLVTGDEAATILNGTGTGAETEGAGVDTVTIDMSLYFAKEAKNAAQGEAVEVSFDAQAVQYRNNPDAGTAGADWGQLETGSIAGGWADVS